jgi:hypothetical protein
LPDAADAQGARRAVGPGFASCAERAVAAAAGGFSDPRRTMWVQPRILGQLEVRADGRAVEISGARQGVYERDALRCAWRQGVRAAVQRGTGVARAPIAAGRRGRCQR